MNFDDVNRIIKEYIERADSDDYQRYRLNPNPHYKKTNYHHVLLKILLTIFVVIVIICGLRFINPTIDETNGVSEGIANEKCQVNIYAEVNGEKMVADGTYNVCPGDIITVEASSSEAKIYMIGYYWGSDEDTSYINIYDNHIEIVVPNGSAGNTDYLSIEAVAENDEGDPNTKTKTGWFKFNFIYTEGKNDYVKPSSKDSVDGKYIKVIVDGVEIKNGSTTEITTTSKIKIYSYPDGDVNVLYYKFGEDSMKAVMAPYFRLKASDSLVPGETIKFMVNALYLDGLYVDNKNSSETTSEVYYFVVVE